MPFESIGTANQDEMLELMTVAIHSTRRVRARVASVHVWPIEARPRLAGGRDTAVVDRGNDPLRVSEGLAEWARDGGGFG